MNLNVHFISKKYCEVSADEVNTGTLDADEAKELAIHLLSIATELLEVEPK